MNINKSKDEEYSLMRAERIVNQFPSYALDYGKNIYDMSHEERCEFTRKFNKSLMKKIFVILMMLLAGYLYLELRPAKESLPEPVESFKTAGEIINISVHHSTFSVDSTITTTKGSYQVSGAVSAAKGDSAKLRLYEPNYGSSRHKPKFCIESEIKSKCYYLL